MGMTDTQRRLVYAVFLYTCIEGLVVNIMYPNPIAYLPKDALIGVLYLSMLSRGLGAGGSSARFTGPVIAFSAVCLIFIALPTPVTPLGISVAIKQRIYYVPLLFVAYHYLRGDADLARLLRVIAWSSIPVSLFGIYLYFGGPMALRTLGGEYSHVFFSTMGESGVSFWRVPGTFNSPGQYGAYLSSVAVLLVGFLLVKDLGKSDRRMILLALACLLPAMLVTGSRAPMLLFLVQAGLITMLSRQMSRAGVAAGVLYLLVVVSLDYLGSGVADRLGSVVSADNLERFRLTFFGQLWFTQTINEPLGLGLGVATIGARHFSPPGTVRLVESYLGVLGTEMGVLGVAAFLALVIAIGVFLVSARGWMVNAPGRSIWTAIFLQSMMTILLTSNSSGLDAIPGNLYFWFFVGIAVKMVDLERSRLMWNQMGPAGGDAGPR